MTAPNRFGIELGLAARPAWMSALDVVASLLAGGSSSDEVRLVATVPGQRRRTLHTYPDRYQAEAALRRVSAWVELQVDAPSWDQLQAVAKRPDGAR